MRARSLVREALMMAWAAKAPSMLIVAVVSAMCAAALLTLGQSAVAAATLTSRLEESGTHRLVVLDNAATGFINVRTLTVITAMSTVDFGTALGSPFDAVNGHTGPGGPKIPVWPVLGPIDLTLDRGRLPEPGEVIVTADAMASLGLIEPVGFLTTLDGATTYPVVGSFTATSPIEDLAAGAILAAPAGTPGRELRVMIDDIASASATVAAVMSTLAPPDPDNVAVDSPTAIARTAQDLNTQMLDFGRSNLALILGAGGSLIAVVALTDVLIHRRDLGRRRTLGITQVDLALVVTTRVLVVAFVGAVLGCGAAWLANSRSGILTPPAFTYAVGVLTCLAATVAALPPAVHAARLDPVRVMRTP